MKSLINNTIKESEKRRERSATQEHRAYDETIDSELEEIIQRSRAKIFVIERAEQETTLFPDLPRSESKAQVLSQ